MRARRSLVLSPLLLLTGCLPLQLLDPSLGESETAMVPANPFGSPGPIKQSPVTASYTPPSGEMALRVDLIGRNVLAANPSITVRPMFATLGAPHPEIFHQDTQIIYVTDGLVKRCKKDGELAALLCLELGKMVSEHAAQGRPARGALREDTRPISVPIGNAALAPSDDVALAELGRYENQRKEAARRRPPPDPQALAAGYLEKAGYSRAELDAVAPVLEAADRNYVIEKQFKTPSNAPPWSPVAPQ